MILRSCFQVNNLPGSFQTNLTVCFSGVKHDTIRKKTKRIDRVDDKSRVKCYKSSKLTYK